VRQAPVGNPWHRDREVGHNGSTLSQKAQKRSQCRDQQLSPTPAHRLGETMYESMNVDRTQFIESQCIASKALNQEAPNERQIIDQCCWRETAF